MASERRNPPVRVQVLGSRETVSRIVTVLREVLDVTHTTPAYPADLPYEVHRYIGATGLRTAGLPTVVAEINATVKSWSRGNLTPDRALERIQGQLALLAR